MCLIIQREPNFELPYDKFQTAILNNPDGYGISYPDSGKLITLRSAKEPDPEKLYRFVNEELKDKKIMLHLRYTTVGKTNLRNSHPFPILEKKRDGIDLRMAHNGTIGKYRPGNNSPESDTRNFVREYVRPLFKRMSKGFEPEELLSDPFLKKLLEDQVPSASVLTFIDSEGNSLICNEKGNGGKQDEGWYYSNTYSFNAKHRTPTKTGGSSDVVPFRSQTAGGTFSDKFKDSRTIKFTDKFGIKDVQDLTLLTDDTISAICKQPDVAELLIKELLFELSHKGDVE